MTTFTKKRITAEWELQSKAETKARVDAYERLLTALEKI